MKLYKRLEKWSFWLRYQVTYLEMEYHLKQVLKGKQDKYTKYVSMQDRGSGKTVTLARLSVKYNIPIMVGTYVAKDYIENYIPQKLHKYFRKKKPIVLVCDKEKLLGHKYKAVLLEQGLSPQQMDGLYEVGLLDRYVGFVYL